MAGSVQRQLIVHFVFAHDDICVQIQFSDFQSEDPWHVESLHLVSRAAGAGVETGARAGVGTGVGTGVGIGVGIGLGIGVETGVKAYFPQFYHVMTLCVASKRRSALKRFTTLATQTPGSVTGCNYCKTTNIVTRRQLRTDNLTVALAETNIFQNNCLPGEAYARFNKPINYINQVLLN